ncbi:hypothetical protein SAMN05216559_0135 [Halomicrobium zhouii]|uniref:Uncharacterized protein n=1 Tax=Halomicrobium zhouii TaxID=767519 RepID=A0A1I6K3H6_9EURY|nr:hypothetical protein [Halomicrobium zhouii]SFR85779.1 hypothetical protein SAMN05216559_0135 [Halomicrobium zhouii]
MNSETSTAPAEGGSQNGTVALIKAVRKTFLLLMFAVACFGLLAAIYFDVVTLPFRGLALVVMIVCIAGPFVATYAVLCCWWAIQKSKIPLVVVDRDQKELHLKYFSPAEWSSLEVEGSLATRRTNSGRAYIAEEVDVEQRERVDPVTGETETYAQRVARSSWEGFITPFELMETVYAFKKAKEELVPLAQEALEAKAGADIDVLKNTDRFAGGLLVGAEEDTFFDDPGDAFDWDMSGGVDLDELTERDRAVDDDPDRDDLPEPGSREMQNVDGLEVEADD